MFCSLSLDTLHLKFLLQMTLDLTTFYGYLVVAVVFIVGSVMEKLEGKANNQIVEFVVNYVICKGLKFPPSLLQVV